jgi:hypothetical protein
VTDTAATLARLDAAINDQCMCGCGKPLPAAGPSAYFATQDCQTIWNQRQATNPGAVRGSVNCAEGPMRWRPDLVTAAPPLRNLQPVTGPVAALMVATAPAGNKTVGYDPDTGRYVLRLDDDYRYVEQTVDPARLTGDPDTDRALFAGVWARLGRDLSDPAHTATTPGVLVPVHLGEVTLTAADGTRIAGNDATVHMVELPPGFPFRPYGQLPVPAGVWTILPGTDLEIVAPDPGILFYYAPLPDGLWVLWYGRLATVVFTGADLGEQVGTLVYDPAGPIRQQTVPDQDSAPRAVFRRTPVTWTDTTSTCLFGQMGLLAAYDPVTGTTLQSAYPLANVQLTRNNMQRMLNTRRLTRAAMPDPADAWYRRLLDHIRARHTGPPTTTRPPRRIDPTRGTR